MVGYTLRQERERQKLSIEDIEKGTSIRALYIEHIENGEYDKLPGMVYTKGFIKNYAKFLNLDPEEIAKEFVKDVREENDTAAPANTGEGDNNSETSAESKPVKPVKKPLGHSVENDNKGSSNMLIVAAVVVIAALSGMAWSWLSGTGEEVATVKPQQQQATAQTEQTPVANNTVEPVAENLPAAENLPVNNPDKVNVQARFNDRCWVLVTVDGNVVQEGVVDGGQTLSWEGTKEVSFRLGNAGAVEFFENGQSIGALGAYGDIADKTFTR
ncbi:MAG: DUF4115 domain-containing protein [Selenomonadaceae bacterium]|nr:DUF4115 domain-containing protein [Selenomonadaceae bacterium]